jgi:hypothetical protein
MLPTTSRPTQWSTVTFLAMPADAATFIGRGAKTPLQRGRNAQKAKLRSAVASKVQIRLLAHGGGWQSMKVYEGRQALPGQACTVHSAKGMCKSDQAKLRRAVQPMPVQTQCQWVIGQSMGQALPEQA